MDFEELVNTRKSVRGFKNQPVPRTVIAEIIEVAKRAPSSMNTQPWHVHVLTGEPLEELRRRNMEEMIGGARCAGTRPSAISFRTANMKASTASGRSISPSSCSR